MRATPIALLCPLVLLVLQAVAAGEAPAVPQVPAESLQRWRDAKFGVFICWGPVSIKGTEIGWSRQGPRPGIGSGMAETGVPAEEYDALYKRFNPTAFDASEWARIVKDSGAGYVIFLTKHHDGFCLFDTRETDYSITHTPWGRDVTADLARAFQAAGIRIIWYYSQPDWHHPDYRTERHARYIDYLHAQIRELCTQYGTIDGIWFDGLGGSAADWDSPRLFNTIRSLQPDALINNRAGLPGDFDTPEQQVGHYEIERPWESCITMQATGWSWRPDEGLKSLTECLHLLIQCAGGGGNLALDTGPMPDGRINADQAQRFRDMGRWLKDYGDSIYATTGGPYTPCEWWGVSTRKDTRVFLHILHWGGETLRLRPLPATLVASRVLTGGTVQVEQTDAALNLTMRAAEQHPVDTIVELTLDRPSLSIPPIITVEPGCISVGKPARASAEWSADYRAAMAFDGDAATRWGSSPGSHEGWLEVDLEQEEVFDRIAIFEAPWNRVQRFELQVRAGDTWRTIHSGTTLGNYRARLAPVSARYVRLQILEATEVPTIWAVQLFSPDGTSTQDAE